MQLLIVALALALAWGPGSAPSSTSSSSPDGMAASWAWPVDPPRVVLRPFLLPPEPWQPGHRGVDLAAPDGVLRAPADGVVRFAGWVVDRPVLSIDHGDGVVSSYEPVDAVVAVGERVAAGQILGAVEPGHCASARCVHLGVRVDGEYQNPLLWIGGGQRPVLLPTRRLRRAGARS